MNATCEYCDRPARVIGRDTGECVCATCARSVFVEQATSVLTLRTARMYGASADIVAALTADALPADDAAMMRAAIVADPHSRLYARDYMAGWNASVRAPYGDGLTLERADDRNVSHAWYDGYNDHACGRERWTYRTWRRNGCDADCGYTCDGPHVNVAADVAADVAAGQDAPADTTSAYIVLQVATWHRTGALVHASIARAIAAQWQESAYGNPYSAFASTEAIDDTLADWLSHDIDVAANTDTSQAMELQALAAYVRAQTVSVWHIGSNVAGFLPDADVSHTLSYADACAQYAERLMDASSHYSSGTCECDADATCDMHSTEACASAMVADDVPSRYSYGAPRELAHHILTDSHGRVEFWLTRESMTYASFLADYYTR